MSYKVRTGPVEPATGVKVEGPKSVGACLFIIGACLFYYSDRGFRSIAVVLDGLVPGLISPVLFLKPLLD